MTADAVVPMARSGRSRTSRPSAHVRVCDPATGRLAPGLVVDWRRAGPRDDDWEALVVYVVEHGRRRVPVQAWVSVDLVHEPDAVDDGPRRRRVVSLGARRSGRAPRG